MQIDDLAHQADRFLLDHQQNKHGRVPELPDLLVLRHTQPTTIEAMVYNPVVCLILRGRKETAIGDQSVSFGPGESLVVSHDLPVISRITEASPTTPYLALVLWLDLGIVRSLYDQVGEIEMETGRARSLAVDATDGALIDAFGRYLALADNAVEAAVMAPLILREIHFRLLMAPNGGMLRRLLKRDSHASRISKAIARIRDGYRGTLAVTELADMAGMSPSSFHEHFKAVTGTTPLQYQKDMRLVEARRLLAVNRHSVAAAAFEVGYESPTQFSREYARKFGASPRNDIGATLVAV